MTATAEGHPPLSALWSQALSQAHPASSTSTLAHLSTCDACRHRYQELVSDIAQLTLALEPSPLPALLRESILQAAGEIHRLFDFALPLSRALRISRQAAHGLLLRLDAPRYWQHTPDGWMLAVPDSRSRNARIVRLQAGDTLDAGETTRGRKRGPKLLLVLQGAACDDAGRIYQSAHPADVDSASVRPLRPSSPLTVQPGADFLAVMVDAEPRRARREERMPHVLAEVTSSLESLN